jgi:hypothetical protein
VVGVEVPVSGEVLQPYLLSALDGLTPLAPGGVCVALDGPVAVHVLLKHEQQSQDKQCGQENCILKKIFTTSNFLKGSVADPQILLQLVALLNYKRNILLKCINPNT